MPGQSSALSRIGRSSEEETMNDCSGGDRGDGSRLSRRGFLAGAGATAAGATAAGALFPLLDAAPAVAASGNGPITIAAQGSFAVGGTVMQTPGAFTPYAFLCPTGNTIHGDHAYVQYQVPVKPRVLPLVMWHGSGQFSKTWETTPDGREGFQTIFLRRGWSVYILDQPGRGRAGNRTEGTAIAPTTEDRSQWIMFRLGIWPNKFPGVQFPPGDDAIDQYFRQMTPNTGPENDDVEVAPALELFEKVGPAVLLTHSGSGAYGWLTRMQSDNVKAIVAYEPAYYVFPNDDPPTPVVSADPVVTAYFAPRLVDPTQFLRLTQIPIQIVFGDNIPTAPSVYPGLDMWRVITGYAEQFADAVNSRGGDVTILRLPSQGLLGNTHFPFSDMNNLQVADLLSSYLHSKGLD
jgi:hypothetical protein